MTQCDIRANGNSVGFFIHVPESAMLMERHSGLKTVRILDPEVIASVAQKWNGGDTATVTVELMLAGERKFRYSVAELRMADSTIWLDVTEDAPATTAERPAASEMLQ